MLNARACNQPTRSVKLGKRCHVADKPREGIVTRQLTEAQVVCLGIRLLCDGLKGGMISVNLMSGRIGPTAIRPVLSFDSVRIEAGMVASAYPPCPRECTLR